MKKDAYPGYVMFYTRTAVDALPLTNIKLSYKPCQDPTQVQTDPNNKFYRLEQQREQNCTPELNTNQTFDSRFVKLGY